MKWNVRGMVVRGSVGLAKRKILEYMSSKDLFDMDKK